MKSVLFSPDGTKILSLTEYSLIIMLENFDKNLSNLDVSKVTNMSNLFEKFDFKKAINKNYNIDITNWNVSNVTNMNSMFKDCETFNQDLNKWNVSNVTDMSYMFNNCTIFNNNDKKLTWKVKLNTKLTDIFSGCSLIIKKNTKNEIEPSKISISLTDGSWRVSSYPSIKYVDGRIAL
jgi:surface protein